MTYTNGDGKHAAPVAAGFSPLSALSGMNPLAAPTLAFGDLGILFHSVMARMTHTVGEGFAAACAMQGHEPNARIRSEVLECLRDMGRLHSMVDLEVGRRWRLEAELNDLRVVLAGMQAELSTFAL